MNGIKIKLIGVMLATFFAFSLVATACSDNGSEGGDGSIVSNVNAVIWTAPNTVKILQNKDYDRDTSGFKVDAFRNETEAGQIIFTPDREVKSYSIELSDLTSASGEVLSKESFEIFHQKYIEITQLSLNSSGELGWYPDALLPIEAATRAKENGAKKGENQGLWIEVTPPKTQKAGLYTGSFTLKLDGKAFTVPASVEVYDYTLADENRSKSSFLINSYIGALGSLVAGELDSSWEMYDKYVRALFKYRLQPNTLPGAIGEQYIDDFIETLFEYYEDPRFSHFDIPYLDRYDEQYGFQSIDYDLFCQYLERMAQVSYERNFDLFKNASTYFQRFDEASQQVGSVVNYSINAFNKLFGKIDALAVKLETDLGALTTTNENPAKFKGDIIKSMLNIQHKFVDYYTDAMTANVTYVPLITEYDTVESMNKYGNTKNPEKDIERWWYTCSAPANPYPNYHIDSMHLGSRLLSWMQYDYNVVGNLYWSTTINFDFPNRLPTGDFYERPMRLSGARGVNGDGFLFYPGKPYGVDGPVPTIRIAGIRDGLEEYELLLDLENEYNRLASVYGVSINAKEVYSLMRDRLYYGTKMDTDAITFANVRRELARLLVAAKNDNIAVSSAVVANQNTSISVIAPADKVLTFNEETTNTSVAGGTKYTVNLDMTQGSKTIVFEYDDNAISVGLGGKKEVVSVNDFASFVSVSNLSQGVVTTNSIGYNGHLIKVNKTLPSSKLSMIFDKEINNYINSGVRFVTFRLYIAGSASIDKVNLTLFALSPSSPVLQSIYSAELKSGWNDITLPVTHWGWSKLKTLEELEFEFDTGKATQLISSVYMTDISLTYQLPDRSSLR